MTEQAVNREAPSFKELRDALRHYRSFGLRQVELYDELHHRFSSLEEEKAKLQEEKQALDVRVATLEDNQRQLESELQEKDRRTDEMKKQLVLEVASLRKSEEAWKDRCEEAASAISALQEEQQHRLRLLTQEKCDAAAGFMAEKAALEEESRSSVARLKEVEAQALSSQAQWTERCRSLEAGVQRESRARAEAVQQLRQFKQRQEACTATAKLREENQALNVRVLGLEDRRKQLEAELEEKDRQLSAMEQEVQALNTSLRTEKEDAETARSSWSKLQEEVRELNQTVLDKNSESFKLEKQLRNKDMELNNWKSQFEWFRAYMEDTMAAEKEKERALHKNHEEREEQLMLEITSLRTSEEEWKDRCARREEEAASAISALQEEQHRLRLLRQENRDAAAGFMAEKAALLEKSRSSVARLIEVETAALSSQAQWTERRKRLEAEVQRESRARAEAVQQLRQFEEREEAWTAKEKEWMESKARTKQDIQVLVEQIVKLSELASMNDCQKARFKRANEKQRKQAAKKREEERRERMERERKKI